MPAAYTHTRFGEDVRKRLPKKLQQLISSEQELFSIGLFGPDIFFYYHFTFINKVSRAGFAMHKIRGAAFFIHHIGKIREDAVHAYLLGFLCHFTIDTNCHAYIHSLSRKKRKKHLKMEAGLDRLLFRVGRKEEYLYELSEQIVPSKRNIKIIHSIFPMLTEKQIRRSLRDTIVCHRCRPLHRRRKYPLPVSCIFECKELYHIYQKSIHEAVRLVREFEKAGTGAKLGPLFFRRFDGKKM